METNSDVLRKLGTQVTCALQEVGAQIKYHAKNATNEIGLNIDHFKTPFCSRGDGDVSCSLFPGQNQNTMKTSGVRTYGNHKFGFEIKFHQQEIGLVVANVTGVDPGACNFSWRRRLYSYECLLEHVKGSSYKLTADDVGSMVVVTCKLNGTDEQAEAEVGPVDIDVRSKRLIQEALINNTSRHQLYLLEVNGEKVTTHTDYRHFVLYLLGEEVVLKPEDNLTFSWNNKCRFGTDFPRLKLDLEDELRFHLEFDSDLRFTFRVYNRYQRDLVVLMLRVFHSRVLLNNSFENNQMELTRDGRLDQLVNIKTLNLNSLVQTLSIDISYLILENSRLSRELERSKQEKSFLEVEMKNTIQVFQQQIANELKVETSREELIKKTSSQRELSRQTTATSGVWDQDIVNDENQNLYMELVNRNTLLTEKLNMLTQENNTLQEKLSNQVAEKNRLEKQSKCVIKDLEKYRSENEQLQLKMGELRNKPNETEQIQTNEQVEEKNNLDWKLLDDKLPMTVSKRGSDLKGILNYNPPNWTSDSPDPKILDLSLQIISNGVILETVKLNFKSYFILGSMDDCDFVYKNPQVSRKHFVLQYTKSKSFVIYDLNSKCGTTVNHMKLQPKRYYLLSVGDQIRIGKPGLSTRSYILTGYSIFSENEEVDETKTSNTKRKDKESDIDRVKKIRKIEQELEEELKSTKVEESYYDTNLYLDEYDEFFDERKQKEKKKTTVLNKYNILSTLINLQKRELDVLNNWYNVLDEINNQNESGEPESSIDIELEKVRKKELKQDKLKFQKEIDKIREDLEYNFKLLRVASF